VDRVARALGPGPHPDFNAFMTVVEADAESHNLKLTARREKLLQTELAERDEAAAPVVKRVHRSGRAEPDSLRGRYVAEIDGEARVVEYEPDPDLRDTEQVPLPEAGGIDAFFRREVLPHAPDAWIDESATRIGYEISFTRYFYKPQPLRTLEEIKAEIYALEAEAEGLLERIVGAR
jgi:type I restriction enzyme M protein